MSILNVPPEVMEDHILSHLCWNEVLRFRRVCRKMKVITDSYLNRHPALAPEIEINEGRRTLGAFLKMSIPSTRFFLNNVTTAEEFYCKNWKDISRFLEKYGSLVRHLKVNQVSFHCKKESIFLEALANFQTFEAGHIHAADDLSLASHQDRCPCLKMWRPQRLGEIDVNGSRTTPSLPFPNVFRQLKVFKIGQRVQEPIVNIFAAAISIFSHAQDLGHVALPYNSNIKYEDLPSDGGVSHLGKAILFLRKAMKARIKVGDGVKLPLKTIDFVSYHEDRPVVEIEEEVAWSLAFLRCCRILERGDNGVKFLNVTSSWFILQQDQLGNDSFREYGSQVISLVNLHPCVFTMGMPNLERIVIRSTNRSCVGPNWLQSRPDWPNLKSLDMTVDSSSARFAEAFLEQHPRYVIVGRSPHLVHEETSSLFQFFFEGGQRPALEELTINFAPMLRNGILPVPNTVNIGVSCPNLKKLTLVNWRGTDAALTKLWSRLLGLEQLSLENCQRLSTLAFTGIDFKKKPVFLQLSKLRKLTLKGLDKMPKVSSIAFSNVFSRMKLSHLTLTSDAPLKSVTSIGILSLLKGPFAKSIEKFPLRGWSLANVTPREFKDLGRQFRSFDMI